MKSSAKIVSKIYLTWFDKEKRFHLPPSIFQDNYFLTHCICLFFTCTERILWKAEDKGWNMRHIRGWLGVASGHRPMEHVSLDSFQHIDTNSVSGQYQGVLEKYFVLCSKHFLQSWNCSWKYCILSFFLAHLVDAYEIKWWVAKYTIIPWHDTLNRLHPL